MPYFAELTGFAAHAVFRRPDVFRCPCWKFAHSAIVQLGGFSWAWSEFAHGLIRGQIRPIATARRANAYSPSAQLQRHCCLAPGIFPNRNGNPPLPGAWNIPNCNATAARLLEYS